MQVHMLTSLYAGARPADRLAVAKYRSALLDVAHRDFMTGLHRALDVDLDSGYGCRAPTIERHSGNRDVIQGIQINQTVIVARGWQYLNQGPLPH
jgi:hypothetical protein